MKKKRNGFVDCLQIILKLVLATGIFVVCFYVLNNIFYNKEVYHGESYKSLPKNSLDIVVLGSSHAQYSFVPSFIYEGTGLYSYVLGTACQPYQVSYEMLKEALKTQSPKLVIMEVFTSMPLRSMCEGDSCYIIAEYQMTSEEKINTINMLPSEKAEQYYIDFVNYHNDWRYIDSLNDLKPKFLDKSNHLDYNFGYLELPSEYQEGQNYWRANTLPKEELNEVELDENDINALNNIYDLCKDNNIDLLLYKTPIDNLDVDNLSYLEQVWNWADNHNVSYIDFAKESHDLDFYMCIHSSSYHAYLSGAGIISTRISNEIVNKNYVFDHKYNKELDDIYKQNGELFTSSYLRSEARPLTYINRLIDVDGTIVFRYITTDTPLDQQFVLKMQQMGLTDFDGSQNTYAIIKDGVVIEENHEGIVDYDLNGKKLINNQTGIIYDNIDYSNSSLLNIFYINDYDNNVVDKYIEYRGYLWDTNSFYYDRTWD